MPPSKRKQPLSFRKEEVSQVMNCWQASVSCSLIGTGSIGKSNLIQHLMDSDVQNHYMQEVAAGRPFKTILIDPLLLTPLSSADAHSEPMRCWAGYELLMHRLFLAFYPFDMLDAETAKQFYAAYQSLQDGTNPLFAHIGLRYFEFALSLLMQRGVQIIFMFDEFEELLKQLPVKFFSTLRGLRDEYKNQIAYMTFSRSSVTDIANNLNIAPLEIEPFAELFTDNPIYVGPYNESDGMDMLRGLVKRTGRPYDDAVLHFLMRATGNYAGLLRACFNGLEYMKNIEPDVLRYQSEIATQELGGKSIVLTECKGIWTSISPHERGLLLQVHRGETINIQDELIQRAYVLLTKKKLLVSDGKVVYIQPPVLRRFLDSNPEV